MITKHGVDTQAVHQIMSSVEQTEAVRNVAQHLLPNTCAEEGPSTMTPKKCSTSEKATEISPDSPDSDDRIARSRDRNREHARRTRLRKKQQLEALQKRVKELQKESKLLKQTIEECSIASILLGLSTGEISDDSDELDLESVKNTLSSDAQDKTFFTITGKRKRFVSDADINPPPMKLNIKGKTTYVGGTNSKAQINWKTGVYLDDKGEQQQLTPSELEELRRERNRMHAKMTRDRKKLFISSVEKTITDLEKQNKKMKDILTKQALRNATCVSPDFAPLNKDAKDVPTLGMNHPSPSKKVKSDHNASPPQ